MRDKGWWRRSHLSATSGVGAVDGGELREGIAERMARCKNRQRRGGGDRMPTGEIFWVSIGVAGGSFVGDRYSANGSDRI